jgi:hypothetical protein
LIFIFQFLLYVSGICGRGIINGTPIPDGTTFIWRLSITSLSPWEQGASGARGIINGTPTPGHSYVLCIENMR